jgi:hypothetical protein
MGMNRADAYYEPEDDPNDSEEVQWEIDQLLKGELNPDDYSNFSEAICEADRKDREAVEDILCQPQINFEALGRKLYDIAYTYAEKWATDRVLSNY